MTSGRSTSYHRMVPLSSLEKRVLSPAPRLMTTAFGCRQMNRVVPSSMSFVRMAIPVWVIQAPSNLEKS